MLRLRCLEGKFAGQVLEFNKEAIVVGREIDCDLMLDDVACSRHHAKVFATDEGYAIQDLDSTNGLQVNGKKTKGKCLHFGDKFSIGRNLFVFATETAMAIETKDSDPYIENTITLLDAEKLFGKVASLQLDDDSSVDYDVTEESSINLEEVRHANRQMRIAYEVSRAITTTLNPEDLYDLICENILEHFDQVERVCIFRRHPEIGALERVKSRTKKSKKDDFPVSRAVLKRVETERIGILASDAAEDDRFVSSQSIALMDLRSLMCVPLTARNTVLGAIYVDNCTIPACFKTSDLELLTILGNQAAFALENAALYADLQVSFYQTVKSLSNALEAKDPYTRGHSDRVAKYAVGIGEQLGLPPEQIADLKTAAELHDIGKIAIDEAIISKKGKLTDEEFEVMKQHPQLGVKILKPIRFLKQILPFILHHHERYNGEGYPGGLKGEEIPLEARVLNLADAFDAMTTQRPYNTPKTFREAYGVCVSEAAVSFDETCVEAFGRYLATLPEFNDENLSDFEPDGTAVLDPSTIHVEDESQGADSAEDNDAERESAEVVTEA